MSEVLILQGKEHQRIQNGRSEGEYAGRPPSVISREAVDVMRKRGLGWNAISRQLPCSNTTLARRRHEWEKQDIEAHIALAFDRTRETDTPEPSKPIELCPPPDVYDPNYGSNDD